MLFFITYFYVIFFKFERNLKKDWRNIAASAAASPPWQQKKKYEYQIHVALTKMKSEMTEKKNIAV